MRRDTTASARWAGGVLVLAGIAIGVEATTFDVGFLTDPIGPKALPLLVALILIGSGLKASIRADVAPSTEAVPTESGPLALGRAAAAAAAFLMYALALPWIGFFLSTTVVVAALSALFGAPRLKGLASAALLSAVLWGLFVYGLGLPLPLGDLWIR